MTLIAGAGSQTSTGDRWGDYSALTVDPVDDHTFWFTSEYYTATASVNWKTRIGSFKFPPQAPIVISANGSSIVSGGRQRTPRPWRDRYGFPQRAEHRHGRLHHGSHRDVGESTGAASTNPTPAAQNFGAVCTPNGTATQQYTFTVIRPWPVGRRLPPR